MKFLEIRLRDVRNLASLFLEPGPCVNVIRGENAQGKTNLIEGLWLLSGARSFRGVKDAQIIRFNQERARIEARFLSEGREQEAALEITGKRTATLNGIPCEGGSGPGLPMVVFAPAHLALVRDGPAARRHFLDSAIGRLYPTYEQNLSFYARSLSQRNTLLRDAFSHPSLRELLDVWDQNLAKAGAQIIRLRRRYVGRLLEEARRAYDGLSSGREALSLSYVSSAGDEEEPAAARDAFLRALSESRESDLRLGQTTRGAHRDDLSITVNGLDARQYGSQGQQRSCVLALKLAECGILKECTGEEPVVLLDDVMSELDARRRDYLLHRMEGRQVFLTCCEELPGADASVKQWILQGGALQP